MSGYQLSDTRTRIAQLAPAPVSLHTVLDPSPEPTTTASGIVPGQALLDNAAPVTEVVSEPESQPRRYSQRVRISTERIKPHNALVAAQNRKRQERKSRQEGSTSGYASEQSTTTNHASDTEGDHPHDAVHPVHSTTGSPTGRSGPGGDPDDSRLHQQSGLARLLSEPSTTGVRQVSAPSVEVSRALDGTGGSPRNANALVANSRIASSRDASSRIVASSHVTSEADAWDFSVDHERLEAELSRLIDADPKELAQISPRNLQAILKEVVIDSRRRSLQAREVQPPRLEAQAEPVANNPITVGGGHHLDAKSRLNRPGLSSRNQEPENTDTEDESDLDDLNNQPLKPKSNHVPIDPNIRHLLDLPINHPNASGKAQGPTQPNTRTNQALQSSQTQPSLSRTSSQPDGHPSSVNRSPPNSQPRSVNQTRLPLLTQHRQSGGQGSRSHTTHPAVTHASSSGNAVQAQRASKTQPRAPEPRVGGPSRLPPAMNNALNLARARQRLRREHERRTQQRQVQSSNNAPATTEQTFTPSPPELMEDNEEERIAAEAEANGQAVPAARDVHGNERQVLTSAKLHLFAYSIVEGAYQSRVLAARWAGPVYELTFGQEFPDLALEAPSSQTIQIMVNALPTYRGKIKDALRPLPPFRLGFKKPALTSEDIEHNRELFAKIHPNTFHCLEYDPPYGHYESDIVTEAIALALFPSPTSVGVAFQDYFNPVPLTAVAFVLANLQFCIEEYETGQYQARELNASDMLNKYVAHLRGLKAAQLAAKGRFARLTKEWFNYGFDYSGAMELDDPFTQPVTQASDIRPDTPTGEEDEHGYLPDSEPEEADTELDEEGRYTKRAKGKGRA
ncbi:hypothetical protein FRC08_013768 [Ceratobasidium sp. 394]|nr:hypothetical protein FRC08_013768 [Ceratobasidium sp. 394]